MTKMDLTWERCMADPHDDRSPDQNGRPWFWRWDDTLRRYSRWFVNPKQPDDPSVELTLQTTSTNICDEFEARTVLRLMRLRWHLEAQGRSLRPPDLPEPSALADPGERSPTS